MQNSMSEPRERLHTLWSAQFVLELLSLAVILWIAHFVHLNSFGLYEDDYSHISPPLGWNLSQLLDSFKVLANWPLGRPLGYFLNFLLAFVGGKLGGLSTLFVMDYLIQVGNAVLSYFLLRRIGQQAIAWLGAAIFGIFPATTTHIFLMHSLGQEYTSLMFLLVASHCYLSGRKVPAYLISLACLLTYETPYTVFLAVPLLLLPWDRSLLKALAKHAAVWLGILLAVVAVRALMGEGRIVGVGSSAGNVLGVFGKILVSMYTGPAVALSTFATGPAWVLSHWKPELTLVVAACFGIFFFMLHRLALNMPAPQSDRHLDLRVAVFGLKIGGEFNVPREQTLKLLVTAVILLSVAYLFSFTHFPPIATYGRLTSVHLAATLGGTLLFAAVASLVLEFFKSRKLGYAGIGVLALYLSLLVAYRFTIQLDFAKAWQNEQRFWTNVVQQVPDMSDGMMIFVFEDGLPSSHFILTHSWADPLVLQQIYQFPSTWQSPPRLFVVPRDWAESVIPSGDGFSWRVPSATWPAHWELLPDSNVVVMKWKAGRLVRQTGAIPIGGETLQLKPPPSVLPPAWQKGALYPLLISGQE